MNKQWLENMTGSKKGTSKKPAHLKKESGKKVEKYILHCEMKIILKQRKGAMVNNFKFPELHKEVIYPFKEHFHAYKYTW